MMHMYPTTNSESSVGIIFGIHIACMFCTFGANQSPFILQNFCIRAQS